MESKKVFIHANETEMSKRIETLLREKLVKSGLRTHHMHRRRRHSAPLPAYI